MRFDLGPGLVRRENVQRVAMLTANVAGADLAGTVESARAAIARAVPLPEGYQIVFGGQFEEAARSVRNLAVLAAARPRRDVRPALRGVPQPPPRADRPGEPAAGAHRRRRRRRLGGGVLSVASLVGFITLFGIATRNGVLLVSHYEHLMREEAAGVDEAVRRGLAGAAGARCS